MASRWEERSFRFGEAFVCTQRSQVGEVIRLLNQFCRFSGAELNLLKSRGAWLGEWASNPSCLFRVAWEEEMPRYLGVNLNQSAAVTQRWKPKLSAAERKRQPWRHRHIVLFTRAHVCNAIAYPAVLYGARITTIDAGSLNKLHRSWAVFLWRSTYEPMRRSNLFWSLERGGLGLVNVELN